MSRFTKRDTYGHAYTNETIYDRGMTSEDGVHFEKHYFENGASAYDGKPIDRLCELEDKIEQGDVVEVRHGEWVGIEYDGYADGCPVYDKWECSECHEEYNSDGEPPMFNYCPECGAKMDGERRTE